MRAVMSVLLGVVMRVGMTVGLPVTRLVRVPDVPTLTTTERVAQQHHAQRHDYNACDHAEDRVQLASNHGGCPGHQQTKSQHARSVRDGDRCTDGEGRACRAFFAASQREGDE